MLPPEIVKAFRDYVERRIEPSTSMRWLLENNFVQGTCAVDDPTRPHLLDIAKYICNELPGRCWGSQEKVDDWLYPK